MTVLPLSEVKAKLSEIADEVHRTHDRVTVTRNGHDYVVLMSVDDLASMEETIALLSDPDEMREVQQAMRDFAEGKVYSTSQVEQALAKRLRESSSE